MEIADVIIMNQAVSWYVTKIQSMLHRWFMLVVYCSSKARLDRKGTVSIIPRIVSTINVHHQAFSNDKIANW